MHKKLLEYKSADDLSKILNLDKNTTDDWQATLSWAQQYLKYSLNTSHPNFSNRMWSGANPPSMLGEMITALSNTSSCTFESAPVSTLMENYMIEQMLQIIGFTKGEGQMTTGSSNANMIAMMVARNLALKNSQKQGLFNQQKLCAFVNVDAHYSLDKAANILGIGTDNLIKIPSLNNGSIDIELLETAIKKTTQQGNIAFFVCATLGTTVFGAYDNINDLLHLKQKYNFWLHGDGAWGGSAIMSEKLKAKFLYGIERIDSFTMDFHKMLGSNLMCNFLLINQQDLLSKTCSDGDTSYIFRDKKMDLGQNSLQCGRRVDSLKWFLDWKFYGKIGFAKRLENYYNLAKFAENLVKKNTDLELINPRFSFNICFRFNASDDFNQKLRDKLYQNADTLLSLAWVKNKLIFRLLISNINVNEQTLINLFSTITDAAKKI